MDQHRQPAEKHTLQAWYSQARGLNFHTSGEVVPFATLLPRCHPLCHYYSTIHGTEECVPVTQPPIDSRSLSVRALDRNCKGRLFAENGEDSNTHGALLSSGKAGSRGSNRSIAAAGRIFDCYSLPTCIFMKFQINSSQPSCSSPICCPMVSSMSQSISMSRSLGMFGGLGKRFSKPMISGAPEVIEELIPAQVGILGQEGSRETSQEAATRVVN
ncbi:hypothetical protein BJX76DRAFT_292796 [Aspergillus varians]